MAINFVTGLPRHGKTLWTLVHVKDRAEREGRQVYYCNIPGVTIDGWKELDHPDKWLDLPDGAIIVIDELQDFWPKQPSGQKPPEPILELSKHGKRGFDFYFITQEPNLVHSTPRDLCQHHYYIVRAFGTHNAMVHKYERIQLHPDRVKSKSEKLPWRYPSKAFTWYKSADVHNIKRSIPLKLVAIPLGLILAGAMAYFAFLLLSGAFGVNTPKPAASSAVPFRAGSGPNESLPGLLDRMKERSGTNGAAEHRESRSMTREEYLAARQPRVPGLPHTAPVYDEIARPVRAPVPVACVQMESIGCRCYSQQGTLLPSTPLEMCRQIVEQGFFVDFDPGPELGRGRDDREPVRSDSQRTRLSRSNGPEAVLPISAVPNPRLALTDVASAYRRPSGRVDVRPW